MPREFITESGPGQIRSNSTDSVYYRFIGSTQEAMSVHNIILISVCRTLMYRCYTPYILYMLQAYSEIRHYV